MKTYLMDEEQFQKLRVIQARLHGGSDAMRDEGHRMWLVLNQVAEQAEEMPETPAAAPTQAKPESKATPEEIAEARRRHGEDGEVEIDDNAAASRADEHTWVAAWVCIDNQEDA